LVRLLVAGSKDFVDGIMVQANEFHGRVRVVSATTELSCAVQHIEQRGGDLDAVLIGHDEQRVMDIIGVIEGASLKLPVFVSEDDPVRNRRKWLQHRVKIARAGRELKSVCDYFASRPETAAERERPVKKIFPASEEEFVRERVDAVAQRERANRAVAVRQKVVAVFGNKGGVGKTVIVDSMALSIVHLTGLSVAVIDLDMNRNYGNALSYFGFLSDAKREEVASPRGDRGDFIDIVPERTVSAWSKFNFDRRFDRRYVEACMVRVRKDLYVLPPVTSIKDAGLVDDVLVHKVIGTVQRHFDIVLVDAGNTLTNAAVGALDVCDELYLVVEASLAAIDSLVDFLTDTFNKIRSSPNVTLLVNRVFPEFPYPVSEIQEYAGGLITRDIPEDDAVRKLVCCSSRVPYCGSEDTPFTRAVERLLVELLGPDVVRGAQAAEKRGLFGFLKRLKAGG